MVTFDNDCSKDIRAGIATRNRYFFALAKIPVMKIWYLSKYTKLQIHNTVIKSTVMYGCEAWVMTEQVQSHLERCMVQSKI